MGKVWLCEEKTAEHPFFLEEECKNLYSFEELCYYLYENTGIVTESFFNEKLCQWLEMEVGQEKLSRCIREGIRREQNGCWCMEQILRAGGYYNSVEIKEALHASERMVNKSPLEREKLRADRFLKEGRYRDAIIEYQRILGQTKQEEENSEIVCRIWNNMGTAYVRQMLFEQAVDCYKRAYECGQDERSREHYLLSLACLDGQIPENESEEIKSLQMLEEKRQLGDRMGYEELLENILRKLREEYRKCD